MKALAINLLGAILLGASLNAAELPLNANGQRTLYLCKARSLTGRYYSATGTDPQLTQDAAMQKCSADSWRCYRTGCRVTDSQPAH